MSKTTSKLKPFFFALVGFFAALGVLSFSHVGPAQAQSPGVNLAQLVAQVNALQGTVTSQGNTITSQAATISALQAKTAPLSVSNDPYAGGTNTLLTIKGVNVQIVDGKGSTNSRSGLGNLIIGYNAAGNDQGSGDVRTGSHNLILGDYNNYESFGGLVAGSDNTVSGAYASITGGSGNTAAGIYASITGGAGNTASYYYASISGGESNTARGFAAAVSGGNSITQSSENGWSGGSYHSP